MSANSSYKRDGVTLDLTSMRNKPGQLLRSNRKSPRFSDTRVEGEVGVAGLTVKKLGLGARTLVYSCGDTIDSTTHFNPEARSSGRVDTVRPVAPALRAAARLHPRFHVAMGFLCPIAVAGTAHLGR